MSKVIKYQLPEIKELKGLGFKFKHRTISDFFNYVPTFVKNNEDALMKSVLEWFDPDADNFIGDDPNEDMEFTFNNNIYEANKRLKRLRKTGKIEFQDYYKVVHPVHRNKPDVLISVWENNISKYALDTHLILEYPKPFGLTRTQANQVTLQNEIYKLFIKNLTSYDVFKPFQVYSPSSYRDQIDKLESELDDLISAELKKNKKSTTSFLRKQILEHQLRGLKELEYEEIFENPRSTKEKAGSYLLKILYAQQNILYISQTTSIEDKMAVLRVYLKEQTPHVQKSKNTRSKGIHEKKAKRIKTYIKKYPDKNNSEVARALKVDRKTVRKYRSV